jgi:surface polysaccharide O-acyltransferase-like enzyme
MEKKNYSIDSLRLLGAFCVVILHSPLAALPNAIALSLRLGSRWAVPFFFLVSGYFVAKNLKPSQEVNIGRSIGKLTAVFLVANVVYALFYVVDLDASTSFDLTFVKLIVGQAGHLWYIGSAIVGLILLQHFANRYSDGVLLVIALGVFGLILTGEGYSRLSGFRLQYEVARYVTSIPFLFGGFLLARHETFLRFFPVWLCLVIAVLGLGLEAGEAVLLYKKTGTGPHNQEMLVGTALCALGVFCGSLVLQQSRSNRLARWGSQYSLLIYLYHILVIKVLFSMLHLGDYSQWFYYFSPLIAFGVTLLAIIATYKLMPRVYRVISGG